MACTCRETQLVLFGEILEKIRILNLVLKPSCECRYHKENCQNSMLVTVTKNNISVLRGLFKTEISFKGRVYTVYCIHMQKHTTCCKFSTGMYMKTMLSTRLFSHENNVITALFNHLILLQPVKKVEQ